ncbi:hypothetical protein [Fimbriiglobus ruber]|uniref:Uncharacterized protein n=1 Tax=Fimbriiglobus ruber TaxID=1908690 RepID=A0A225DDQ5_9BACT|nr:hypothetical protein [Fimbriiglobus ruber]OWK34247.1 hypothetical protein FRUB_10218 [Fimbriiglobus ruber]
MNLSTAVRSHLIQHMPTAAVASGLASQVDHSAWAAEMTQRFPLAVRPVDHSVPGLTRWLGERGVAAGPEWVKALRGEWMKERMRAMLDAEWVRRTQVEG